MQETYNQDNLHPPRIIFLRVPNIYLLLSTDLYVTFPSSQAGQI